MTLNTIFWIILFSSLIFIAILSVLKAIETEKERKENQKIIDDFHQKIKNGDFDHYL